MKGLKSKLVSFPYLIWMVVFIVAPLALVAYFAFTNESGAFTFNNILQIGKYGATFVSSIWLAFIATVICLVLGFPISYFISRMDEKKQSIMLMLVMLPMWMNFLLRTYAWMTLLEKNGLINRFFGLFGLGPFEMINTQGAVVLGMVYNYLPFIILPLYSVMTKIDNSLIHAAQDLGASPSRVLGKVLIPLAVPGITTGITMVFVPSVSTFIISKMLGGGSTQLIGDLIEMQFLGGSYNPHLGSALSLVLMLIVLLCMSITNRFDEAEMEEMLV